jgi:tRNA pseudouridine38-40 synthase
MPRYFIELAYKGGAFSGFQAQENELTIQGELDKALQILFKQSIVTTTSSRTDAGVHAYQNFLHWDIESPIPTSTIYSLNSILHQDIVIKNIFLVSDSAHARFDATGRKYAYHISFSKNPFLKDSSYHFPFHIEVEKMNQAACLLKNHTDFTSFSKKKTDVKTFNCSIIESYWEQKDNNHIIYHVQANRFLRGMVKALVGTQLLVGRGKINLEDFEQIILSKDCTQADFSPPSYGLFLEKVIYQPALLTNPLPNR